jgi:two-component system sensor histidine kinase HydH
LPAAHPHGRERRSIVAGKERASSHARDPPRAEELLNTPSNPLPSIGASPRTAPSGVRAAPDPISGVALALAEQLPVAVLVTDHEGQVILANRAAQELLLAAPATVRGRPVTAILGRSPALERALAAAQRGSGGSAEITLGGGELPLRVTVVPIDPPGGALVLLSAVPASEPEEPHAHLAALGRASAGMAHEIRNPLAGIGTNAEVLRRQLGAEDPRRRLAEVICGEVARLDRLIEELLQFARPPAPRLAAHDLRDSIERALTLAQSRIDAAQVAIRLRVEGEPPAAFVDPDQMAQVLLNVILNAVQAMPDGGELAILLRAVERLAPVTGRAGRRAEDQAHAGPLRRFIELEVRDTGVGIPEGDLPKLFEPFFTTRASGTGLGLPISQGLVRQHGGAILVESQLGRGTTVTILIPVEKRRGPR